MTTFNNGESGASVRAKINATITKVDGIEAGADVTDTANVTAAGAVMDSELTDETAVKALDQGVATTDSPTFVNVTSDFDLAAIATTKAETAVDVFVYDTSKDSDGGAWRKRTQHTSWYNETLNTATRGSRREFPAVAVIVAESNKVTIYDGDDPSLPMWATLNISTATQQGCFAQNGIVGIFSGTVGIVAWDFIAERLNRWITSGKQSQSWSRVDGTGPDFSTIDASAGIVNNAVNDVAMTVLPDARVDPATGLPVPTIAVATQGGVSVIKDDGTVADSALTISVESVTFTDAYDLVWGQTGSAMLLNYYPSWETDAFPLDAVLRGRTSTSSSDYPYINTVSQAKNTVSADGIIYFGDADGMSCVTKTADGSEGTALVSYIADTYNTGWMNGDIKGAFLSDTDDTDLVGSGELVTNGTFDTDTSGWTVDNGSATSTSSEVVVTSAGSGNTIIRQDLTTVAGATYILAADFVATSGGNAFLSIAGSSQVTMTTAGSRYFLTFRAASSATRIQLYWSASGTGETRTFDNVSVKLADEDRSVNNNGLIVNGTVTRSPVATGADLVAYSGFSASNYLEQPYNSDLDFGTGDFCVMGWVKCSSFPSVASIFTRSSITTSGGGWFLGFASGALKFWSGTSSYVGRLTATSVTPTNVWSFCCVVRDSGVLYLYQDGNLSTSVAFTDDISGSSPLSSVGYDSEFGDYALTNGSLALLRISATAPTAEQIAKIYEDEKFLFQENAQATLYGSSDAVTALAHDPVTDLLHVGTSAGRSVFQGLRRVENTTDAVGAAISASNNLVVEE